MGAGVAEAVAAAAALLAVRAALGQPRAPQPVGSASARLQGQAAPGPQPEQVLAGPGSVARLESAVPEVLPGQVPAGLGPVVPRPVVPRALVVALRLAQRAQADPVALAGPQRVAAALRLDRGTALLLPAPLVPARRAQAGTRPLTVSAPRA